MEWSSCIEDAKAATVCGRASAGNDDGEMGFEHFHGEVGNSGSAVSESEYVKPFPSKAATDFFFEGGGGESFIVSDANDACPLSEVHIADGLPESKGVFGFEGISHFAIDFAIFDDGGIEEVPLRKGVKMLQFFGQRRG